MGKINNRMVDNGGVEVYTSYHPLEYTSASLPDLYNTYIKFIYYYELDQLL